MNSGQSALSGRRLWVWPSTARWCLSGAPPSSSQSALMEAVSPPPRCSPRFILTAAGPRIGLRRRDRGCQGHRGLHPLRSRGRGRLPGRLAAELVRILLRPGLTIAVTVWTNTTNTLRWMEASTPSSQKYSPTDQPLQIWACHDVGSAAQELATTGGPNRAIREPRPRRATCTDAGVLTPGSVFVDDEDAADRRPAKATSADLISVGRTDATERPRATVDYARPS
jgi:hypothetical protein